MNQQHSQYLTEIRYHATKLREYLVLRERELNNLPDGFPSDLPDYIEDDEELDLAVSAFVENIGRSLIG